MPTTKERLRHTVEINGRKYLSAGLAADLDTPGWEPAKIEELEAELRKADTVLGAGTHILSWGDDAPVRGFEWDIVITQGCEVMAVLSGGFIESSLYNVITLVVARDEPWEWSEEDLRELETRAERAIEAGLATFTGDGIN